MDRNIKELLTAFSHGPADFKDWLVKHPDQFNPWTAEAVREVYQGALQARDGALAELAILCASSLYLYLGDRYHALYNMFDYYQLQFMRADSIPAYESVYQAARDFIDKADEIRAVDMIFQGAVLAADTSFFAAELLKNKPEEKDWIFQALQNLALAAANHDGCAGELWMQKFVSLGAAVLRTASSVIWFDEALDKKNALLALIAKNTEKWIPLDFAFPGDPEKSVRAAQALALASYEYGSAEMGNRRLDTAIARAEQEQMIETLFDLRFSRYRGGRDTGATAKELARLRRELRADAENYRGRYRSRAGRLWAADSCDPALGEILRDELTRRNGDAAKILHAVEATKSRMLLDFLAGAYTDFPDEKVREQAAAFERNMLKFNPEKDNDLMAAEMRLASLLSIGTYWDRSQRAEQLDDIERFYAGHDAGFRDGARGTELHDIQACLREDELLLEYYMPYHPLHPAKELFLFAVTQADARIIPVSLDVLPESGFIGRMALDGRQPVDVSPLGEQVINLRVAIQNGDETRTEQLTRAFHALLIEPLLQQGIELQNYPRLIVVPHGVLHYVPFAALMDASGKYLTEHTAIVMAPSASVWQRLAARKSGPVDRFLGMGNPALGAAYPALDAAEKEIAKIAEYLAPLETELVTGEAATEDLLRAKIKGQHIVHLATHGEFPEEDALDFHRILLSPGPGHDGHVTAEELRGMPLSETRLMVLSICNGGIYRFGPGDEPYGLAAALCSAGVQNLISTLWPLEDQIGRFFMMEFYRHLLAHGPAETLRRAAQQFIADDALVRHWAAFVLVGAGRPFEV